MAVVLKHRVVMAPPIALLRNRRFPASWKSMNENLRIPCAQSLKGFPRSDGRSHSMRLTGFRDEQGLRRAFIQQMSATPKEYRERFGRRKSAMNATIDTLIVVGGLAQGTDIQCGVRQLR
jgi:hypothetical protein